VKVYLDSTWFPHFVGEERWVWGGCGPTHPIRDRSFVVGDALSCIEVVCLGDLLDKECSNTIETLG
jgi:hypothetical protein